jgi:uncharacterized protein (TIGR02266 family)
VASPSPLGSRRRELKRAGVAAAREARGVLAGAIALLDDEVASEAAGRVLAEPLAAVVATLYRAEVGGPEDVRDRLREAGLGLGRALEAMHADGAERALDRAGPLVARTLAILHPARAELERELALPEVRSEPPPSAPAPASEPVPLSRSRSSERRSAPRVPIETSVGAHAASHFLSGRTGDLSTSGLFVATPEPLPVGTLVTIGLVLEDGHRVTCDATVTWVRGPHAGVEGMGVKFTRISEEDCEAIARALAIRGRI